MDSEKIIELLEHENITLSSINSRAWAYFVDEILVTFLFAFIYWDTFKLAQTPEATMNLVNSLVSQVILLKVLYHAFFIWYSGATVGKMLFKIKVISIDDFEKPLLFKSILRSFVRIASETIFYLGFLWALFNPTKQTWHDYAAGTLVVNA